MKKVLNIYLIDDDESECELITSVLKDEGYLVYEFESTKNFLRGAIIQAPAVILIDIDLPELTALELQKKLNGYGEITPIVFICTEDSSVHIVNGFRNGAHDFIFRPIRDGELVEVVKKAFMVQSLMVKGNQKNDAYRDLFNSLTSREKEVYEYLVKGSMSKDIADFLKISTSTVKLHKSKVMTKMGVSSLQALTSQYLFNKIG